jgi:hypothetical protein
MININNAFNKEKENNYATRLGIIIPTTNESNSKSVDDPIKQETLEEIIINKVRAFAKASLAQIVDYYESIRNRKMMIDVHKHLVVPQIKMYRVRQLTRKQKKDYFSYHDIEKQIEAGLISMAEYKRFANETCPAEIKFAEECFNNFISYYNITDVDSALNLLSDDANYDDIRSIYQSYIDEMNALDK